MNNKKDIVTKQKTEIILQKKDDKLFGLWSDKNLNIHLYIRNLRKIRKIRNFE
jgi:hypothetical protein